MNREPLWVSANLRLGSVDVQRPVPPMWPDLYRREPLAIEAPDFRGRFPAADADAPEEDAEDDIVAVDGREYGEVHREDAVEAFSRAGFEAVGFYAPISFAGEEWWGIYYNERALWGLAAECVSRLPSADIEQVVTELTVSIDEHEAFHAAVELFALVADDFRTFILPYASEDGEQSAPEVTAPPATRLYRAYDANVYRRNWPGAGCVEESLATAHQFNQRCRVRGLSRVLQDLTRNAPPAYAKWQKYREKAALGAGLLDLCGSMIDQAWIARNIYSTLTSSPQPQLWVPSINTDDLDALGPLPRYLWRADHRAPAHFAPSIIGNVKTSDIVRCVEKHFSAEKYTGGGRHGVGVRFPNGHKIPYSTSWKTVPSFFLKQVADAIGIPKKQLVSTCI